MNKKVIKFGWTEIEEYKFHKIKNLFFDKRCRC